MNDDLVSPLGASREHSVPCSMCRAETWTLSGVCGPCRIKLHEQAEFEAGFNDMDRAG